MEKLDNKTLDEKAKILHDNYSDNDCSFRTCLNEFNAVYNCMFRVFGKRYEEVFSVGFLKAIKSFNPKAIKSFDPEKSYFKQYLHKILYNKAESQHESDMRQIAKKVGEETDELGKKHPIYDYFEELDKKIEDDEGNILDSELADKSENVEENVLAKIQGERVYLTLADLSVEKKKEYSKKKTFCYPPLFFTDLITALQKYTESTEFIDKNRQKLDKAAELPFANHYLVRECSSVSDFRDNLYKPLSDFTGKESDKNKECGNPKPASFLWLDYSVYTSYVLKITGKSITDGSISDHAKKFAVLMRDALKEKGESL